MSKSTISTFELFQMFPDAEAARVYMEGKRWPDGAVCPACDEAKRITTRLLDDVVPMSRAQIKRRLNAD